MHTNSWKLCCSEFYVRAPPQKNENSKLINYIQKLFVSQLLCTYLFQRPLSKNLLYKKWEKLYEIGACEIIVQKNKRKKKKKSLVKVFVRLIFMIFKKYLSKFKKRRPVNTNIEQGMLILPWVAHRICSKWPWFPTSSRRESCESLPNCWRRMDLAKTNLLKWLAHGGRKIHMK